MSNPREDAGGGITPPESSGVQRLQPTAWRINHPEAAGGAKLVFEAPTEAEIAALLKFGISITPLLDGPLDEMLEAAERLLKSDQPLPSTLPDTPEAKLFESQVRAADENLVAILGTVQPHWHSHIENTRRLVQSIARAHRRIAEQRSAPGKSEPK